MASRPPPPSSPARARREGGAAGRAAEPPAAPRFMVTTVRLDPADWRELRAAALDRTLAVGGAPDASAVLRDILAAWRKGRNGKTTTRSTRR